MAKGTDLVVSIERVPSLPAVCVFTGLPAEVVCPVRALRTAWILPLPGLIIAAYRGVTVPLPLTRRARLWGRTIPRWCAVAVPVLAVVPALVASVAWGPASGDVDATMPVAGTLLIGVGLLAAVVAAAIYVRARRRVTLRPGRATVVIRRVHPDFRAAFRPAPQVVARASGPGFGDRRLREGS